MKTFGPNHPNVAIALNNLERDCYAGESHNAAALMVNTFPALAADPTLAHGQALQSSILTMINSTQHSEWADPKYRALRLRRRAS